MGAGADAEARTPSGTRDDGQRRGRPRALFPILALAWVSVVATVYFSAAGAAGLDPDLPALSPRGLLLRVLALDVLHLASGAAVFVAAWGYGRWALTVPRLEAALRGQVTRPLERFLAAMGIGLGLLSLLALALAPLQLLRSVALLLIGSGGLALAVIRRPWRSVRGLASSLRTMSRLHWVLAAHLGVTTSFALIGALAPEVEYDAVWYHLDFPLRHLDAGTIVDDLCQYVSPYPWGAELLFAYGLAVDGPVAAKVIHFGFGVLTTLAVYSLAVQAVGSAPGRRAGLYAAAVFAATPTVLWEATTAYIDLATAFFVVLALTWVLLYVEHRSLVTVGIAGSFLGLALSTKHLAVIAAVPLALIVLWRSGDRAGVRRVIPVTVLTSIALLPALPWYIRAQVQAGNPFFPTLYDVFGADPRRWTAESEAGLQQFASGFGLGRDPVALLTLPWSVTMHGAAFGGSVGLAFLLFVPLALHRRTPRPLLLVGAFCLGYLALWASPVSALQLRFLVPALGPLAVVAGYGVDRLLVAARQWRPVAGVLAGALVTVVLLLSLPPFLRAHERDRDGYDGWLTHVLREVPVTVVTGAESETDYLQRRIPAYGAVQHLNDVADVDDTVVVVTDPYVDLYAEPRTVPDYAVCLADAGLGRGGPDDHRAMLRTGVDYLLVEDRLRGQSVIQWQDPTFAAQYLDLLYEDGRAQLYRVRPSSLD